jgi:hypothetical protein
MTFDTVRELGLEFVRAKEDRCYGMPALTVGGKLFVVKTSHRSAGRNSVSVTVGFRSRESLIKSNPDVYYLRPHYEPYPVVLVRLDRINRDTLRRLLRSAYRAVSSGAVDPDRPMPRGRRKVLPRKSSTRTKQENNEGSERTWIKRPASSVKARS